MKKHEKIITKEKPLEETLNLAHLRGVKVLAKDGEVVGNVSQIRMNKTKLAIEGIVVFRSLFKKPLYIGCSYIESATRHSFLLKENPSILLRGRRILDSNGKKIGSVKEVVRLGDTNKISHLVAKAFLRKDFEVDVKKCEILKDSIILEHNYDVKRKYIWSKS